MIEMSKLKFLLGQIFIVMLCLQAAFAADDAQLYVAATRLAKAGNIDFAYLQLHKLVNSHPQSRFLENALFSIGEYYFWNNNYYDARETFNRFINDYPQSQAKAFALQYLLKISRLRQQHTLTKELEEKIKTMRRNTFLFRDYKDYKYLSSFAKHYRAKFFIDKIKFYVDEKLFMEIRY